MGIGFSFSCWRERVDRDGFSETQEARYPRSNRLLSGTGSAADPDDASPARPRLRSDRVPFQEAFSISR